uniref:Uncharacterized protein n=1 Tax=Moniliophthora roreri TaxID=221103 RepID=A0A0W0FI27_MONRR
MARPWNCGLRSFGWNNISYLVRVLVPY